MFGLGFGELMVILLIALIFIGPKKLPELAKGLGKGLREFQNATKGFSEQLDQAKRELTDAAQEEKPKVPDAIPVENAVSDSHKTDDKT
mgnify:CR=1 FL=1